MKRSLIEIIESKIDEINAATDKIEKRYGMLISNKERSELQTKLIILDAKLQAYVDILKLLKGK